MAVMRTANQTIIAIDVGNTTAAYGIFRRKKFIATGRVPTNNYSKIMTRCAGHSGAVWIISSVVPQVTRKLISLIRLKSKSARIYTVGQNLKLHIPMRYARKKLGADRLVNIYGAVEGRKLPALIIDFGTAVTFDYVSKGGVFCGGLIVPGVELSAQALQAKTALLPKVKGFDPSLRGLVGHDTRSAMILGLLNGFGALADGVIERFRRQYGPNIRVLATGGWAKRLSAYTKHIRAGAVSPLHTLRSLVLIYQNEVEHKQKRGR